MSRAGPGGRGGPGLPGRGAGGAPGDPGLARARTSLAWTRTALSFAAIGGVGCRTARRVIAAAVAMLEPDSAAKPAQAKLVATASPPGSRFSQTRAAA